MSANYSHNTWVVHLTLFVALLLTVLPLPVGMLTWRPAWLLMTLIFWILALPYRFGAVTALVFGLCVDVLLIDLLGQHAIGMITVAWVVTVLQQRMRMWRVFQQAAVVGMLVGVYVMYNQWVDSLHTGIVTQGYEYLSPALVSALVWPILYNILHTLRVKFRVQ